MNTIKGVYGKGYIVTQNTFCQGRYKIFCTINSKGACHEQYIVQNNIYMKGVLSRTIYIVTDNIQYIATNNIKAHEKYIVTNNIKGIYTKGILSRTILLSRTI